MAANVLGVGSGKMKNKINELSHDAALRAPPDPGSVRRTECADLELKGQTEKSDHT